MKGAFIALCTVVAATATGCAGGRAAAEEEPRPRALTWQQELRVADARQRLTRLCMNRHGFGYREERGLTLRESRPVRYVQDDVAWARTYGYGSRIGAGSERDPNGAYRRSLSPSRRAAFDAALDGGDGARVLRAASPAGGEIRRRLGGCTEEAERELYGDPAEWFRTSKVAMGVSSLYSAQLMADPQLTAAIRAWSRCMRNAGEPYENPQRARDAVRAGTDAGFAAERRTAVADATCARETSLRAVAEAREAYYQDRLRDRFGEDVDTYRRLGHRAYERAVRVVPERR
ncbi:hypothetical protein [Nonomuraea sp. SBT364]|uniref:hypothetical protein n=1 Tax=Nonomuraea sp. SBT364 TaxID=1580530 RepID=UPI0007C78A30|nr:hypothetical protein [Nonomuraea sp. SBT364]